MAASPSEQVKALRELADRIERGEQILPEELADKLAAEVKRAARVGAAVERALGAHEAILAELAK